ncbi:uncharacterized protein I303_106136 [Kwoniella dejecticola CBS 10117]|uniref:Uncharacterized protein n=1 Tax=Kwoniella dejecticola CBS 10117 TaxID=1296121 RepID=A0A1A6A1D4_9TREE|nr:uncharacterized protein I303_06154 [Kwoniella dejecticola CBS 10117]OBR83871.1 hypothetical protein I303_06154 [Kwoniella dejecticola CBS 10117]
MSRSSEDTTGIILANEEFDVQVDAEYVDNEGNRQYVGKSSLVPKSYMIEDWKDENGVSCRTIISRSRRPSTSIGSEHDKMDLDWLSVATGRQNDQPGVWKNAEYAEYCITHTNEDSLTLKLGSDQGSGLGSRYLHFTKVSPDMTIERCPAIRNSRVIALYHLKENNQPYDAGTIYLKPDDSYSIHSKDPRASPQLRRIGHSDYCSLSNTDTLVLKLEPELDKDSFMSTATSIRTKTNAMRCKGTLLDIPQVGLYGDTHGKSRLGVESLPQMDTDESDRTSQISLNAKDQSTEERSLITGRFVLKNPSKAGPTVHDIGPLGDNVSGIYRAQSEKNGKESLSRRGSSDLCDIEVELETKDAREDVDGQGRESSTCQASGKKHFTGNVVLELKTVNDEGNQEVDS